MHRAVLARVVLAADVDGVALGLCAVLRPARAEAEIGGRGNGPAGIAEPQRHLAVAGALGAFTQSGLLRLPARIEVI